MIVETSYLTGRALYWALAKAEGRNVMRYHDLMRQVAAANNYQGDLDWQLEVQPDFWCIPRGVGIQADPIPVPTLDRLVNDYRLSVFLIDDEPNSLVWSSHLSDPWRKLPSVHAKTGSTPLEAAARCVVRALYGHEIDVPEDLT